MNTCFAETQFMTKGFEDWLSYSNANPEMDIGRLLQRSCGIDKESASAYNAPFPSKEHRAAVRVFPNLVFNSSGEFQALSKKARQWWQENFQGKAFVACVHKIQ